jgi:hypothetical protein
VTTRPKRIVLLFPESVYWRYRWHLSDSFLANHVSVQHIFRSGNSDHIT